MCERIKIITPQMNLSGILIRTNSSMDVDVVLKDKSSLELEGTLVEKSLEHPDWADALTDKIATLIAPQIPVDESKLRTALNDALNRLSTKELMNLVGKDGLIPRDFFK